MKKLVAGILAAVVLSGCGGSYAINRTPAMAPRNLKVVALSPQEGNSPEVNGYVNDAILAQGLQIKSPLPAGTRKSLDVDAILSYEDVWRWDLTTYLAAMTINLYDANSGNLLVTGKWTDSFFHTFYRGEGVAKELMQQMMEKVREK